MGKEEQTREARRREEGERETRGSKKEAKRRM
jgi:hypothetical protein